MTDKILEFFRETIRLKRMPRSGWIYSGIPLTEVESVADHSFMVSLVALILGLQEQKNGNQVDLEKVLIMSLIHDLSESVSQDIDRRVRKFSPKKYDDFKKDLDKKALEKIMGILPNELSEKGLEYFAEFMQGETLEAIIVKEADRLETIIQLKNYVKQGNNAENFSEFYSNFSEEADNYQIDLVKKLAKKLVKED
ncbi:MAG: HD domain-containing protein [Candidatus Heimdallarchaeota archaeon]